MEQVIIYLYQSGSNFQYLYQQTTEKVIITNIKEDKVNSLINLCTEEDLSIQFTGSGIVVAGDVEQ